MTATANTDARKGSATATPVSLKEQAGRGLWADAFRRLLRNRMALIGLIVITILILAAIFANVIAPYAYDKTSFKNNNAIPSWLPSIFTSVKPATGPDGKQILGADGNPIPGGYARLNDQFIFGADYLGRDIFSRLIYGARISLSVAFIGPMVAVTIGLLLGCIAGFFGGKVDNLIMRFVDLMYAFPTLLLIILMMAFFRSSFAQTTPGTFAYSMNQLDSAFGGLLFIFIGIGITSWMGMARLSRGQVLSMRAREFVTAAESIGMSRAMILRRHILPNILGPVIVAETLAIPGYISTEAFLSFIGLGVNIPTPSWGSMISEGSQALRTYPNQAIFPALALAVTMFAFNFLGDGLRDALDPRMRGVS